MCARPRRLPIIRTVNGYSVRLRMARVEEGAANSTRVRLNIARRFP